jgi:hypothetical protein
VATLREQGIDFVRFGWLGICACAGTPQPIVDLLNRHIATIVAGPEYRLDRTWRINLGLQRLQSCGSDRPMPTKCSRPCRSSACSRSKRLAG